MSLSKAIKSGKEHRKPYYGAPSFDSSCRPGGGCPWCEGNRFHADRRRRAAADEQIKEWKKGGAGTCATCRHADEGFCNVVQAPWTSEISDNGTCDKWEAH